MNKPIDSGENKRPLSISIICLIDFFIIPIFIYLMSTPMVTEIFVEQRVPTWVLPSINLWMLGYLIVIAGLWRMKKWAAYIYLLLAAHSIATNDLSASSIFIESISIYCVAKSIPKMS